MSISLIDLKGIITDVESAVALSYYKGEGNQYTDIGQRVHDIKYKYINSTNVDDLNRRVELSDYLATQLELYVKKFLDQVDLILPVPSYNARHLGNPNGQSKMMYLIAHLLHQKTSIPVRFDILKKLSEEQAKNSVLDETRYSSAVLSEEYQNASVLLIDDLFGEGNTAKSVAKVLKQQNPFISIHFVSLTKNQFGGIPKHYSCMISDKQVRIAKNGNRYVIMRTVSQEPIDFYLFENKELFNQVQKDIEQCVFDKEYDVDLIKKGSYYNVK